MVHKQGSTGSSLSSSSKRHYRVTQIYWYRRVPFDGLRDNVDIKRLCGCFGEKVVTREEGTKGRVTVFFH